MEHIKKRIGAADIVLLAAVAALGVLLILLPRLASPGEGFVIIEADGTRTEYPLDRDRREALVSNGIALTVVIENGQVYVESAECPDKVCVDAGRISSPGRSIVCVPAKVSVRIGAKEGGDEDFVIG